MNVIGIRSFVPSKNYDESLSFYAEIGFNSEYVTDDLTLFENGECVFFLQRFYNEELANNFMLQVCVTDIYDAFELCTNSKYKTKITPIRQASWGKVFYLWGPVGELLHITQLGS